MKDGSIVMRNKNRKARRGVSLIEVLVVLVLLVLGILIIVRLFPSGFFSINSVGDAALADSLGQAAVQSSAQNADGLPDSILPVNSQKNDLSLATTTDTDFDPDDPTMLDRARLISNETITIPAASGANRRSVYVVNYGPMTMPVQPGDTQLPRYLTVNSPHWKALSADFNNSLGATPDYPQNTIFPGQQQFLTDYTNGKVAVPYARDHSQSFVLMVVAYDSVAKTDKTYTLDFTVPPSGSAGPPTTTEALDRATLAPYPDSDTYYNGGWFDPSGNNTDAAGKTYNYNKDAAPAMPPLPWKGVMLYRPFKGVADTTAFGADPFEFTLISPNITDGANPVANVGAIAFNPRAAGGSGAAALKAQISYLTYSWGILHEDRDVPALPLGNTAAIRLTLKNLKRTGDNNPDNSIYTGLIPNSLLSMIILDLDTGKPIGSTATVPDPTLPEGNINDEDTQGTKADPVINVSFSTGRMTFGSTAFQDGLVIAHRVRIYYAGEGDWTVAVQKAPSYYTASLNSAAGVDPLLLPAQYAFDPGGLNVYFPRCDAGKTVEITGTYVTGTGNTAQLVSFADTVAISPIITTLGSTPYVTVNLGDSALASPVPSGAAVTITAVRGLSERAVVAHKERDLWKVHSVDVLLNRPQ